MMPHIGWCMGMAAALTVPLLLAYNTSPSTTFFNQATAALAWGALVVWIGRHGTRGTGRHSAEGFPNRVPAGPLLACGLVCTWILWALARGDQAPSILASSAALVVAAMVVLWAGFTLPGCGPYVNQARGFWFVMMGTGLLSVLVALIQVFVPSWADGNLIAHSSVAGRAVGNLRQPNHLSSLLLWATIAVIGWRELADRFRGSKPKTATITFGPLRGSSSVDAGLAAAVLALLILAIVLTASRTGLVGVALLALWGLADRRLSHSSRLLLLATPVMYAIAWWGMALWAQAAEQAFGGQQRLAEGDISGSRFRIWADALQLIAAHPWTGVGWGNFNFAWSLTPFPNRHTAFFDHTHNLPLQLAVELGVPMALLICGLLLWGLWRAWRRALAAEPAASAAGRCAVMMVVLIGLHSLLEYPLWYAYFLLPTAFVWGFALGLPPATAGLATGERVFAGEVDVGNDTPANAGAPNLRLNTEPEKVAPLPESLGQKKPLQARDVATGTARIRSWPLVTTGALCVVGAVFSAFDYLSVADIFAARPGAAPLEQRIEAGKQSIFFAHHAHYAAATVSDTPGQEMASFDIASHHLLDTRLMMAWAKAFAEVGDLDRARHLAERLREFRNPASAEFFAECNKARSEGLPSSAWPFQCTPPSRALTWQDFLPDAR